MEPQLRKQLIKHFKQMIQIIEDDSDFLGDFFNDGIVTVDIQRTHTNQSNITTIDNYIFTIASTNHGGFILEDCNKGITIVNDNRNQHSKICDYRQINLHEPKGEFE